MICKYIKVLLNQQEFPFTFQTNSTNTPIRSMESTVLLLFFTSNLRKHNHGINKHSDKTTPQSYSAKRIAPVFRND